MSTLSTSAEQGQLSKLSYSAFSLDKVRKRFGIEIVAEKLFVDVAPVAPTEWLQASLQRARTILVIDSDRFYIEHVDRILGVLIKMVT